VKPTFLTGFFSSESEKDHKTVTNLIIEPEMPHFDFNMRTGLQTRIVQEKKDLPCIETMIRYMAMTKRTNLNAR